MFRCEHMYALKPRILHDIHSDFSMVVLWHRVNSIMSGINPTVRPFLTGRIFQEIFEGQKNSLKKKKLRGGFSENITRQNISRAKKLHFTQSRNILGQNNIWGYEAKPGQAFPPPVSVCASGSFRRSVGSCVPHDVFMAVLSWSC